MKMNPQKVVSLLLLIVILALHYSLFYYYIEYISQYMNRDESGAPIRIVFLMIDAIGLAVIIAPWLKKEGK